MICFINTEGPACRAAAQARRPWHGGAAACRMDGANSSRNRKHFRMGGQALCFENSVRILPRPLGGAKGGSLAPQPSTRRNRRPHDYWVHRGFTFQNVVLSIFTLLLGPSSIYNGNIFGPSSPHLLWCLVFRNGETTFVSFLCRLSFRACEGSWRNAPKQSVYAKQDPSQARN